VTVLPRPTRTSTYQTGSVWKSERATLDVDAYYIRFDNAYSATYDPATNNTVYFAAGNSITKGVEAESTVVLGGGLNVYINGTLGTAKYADTGLWVQNAPKDTETLGIDYHKGRVALGMFAKRVGKMFNDNGGTHEAVGIDPFTLANVFLNYTLSGSSRLGGSRIRFAVNNLFDDHNIVAVTPALKTTSVASPNDTLLLLPGRSVSVALTLDLSRATRTTP
jgi:iron complex outermembrane receptor protein